MTLGRRGAIGAGIAGLLAGATYFALRPTDESRIRAKLARLAAAVRVTEADMQVNPIGRISHVSGAFEEIFEPDVRVSVPELGTLPSGRLELAQYVAGAPHFVRTFDVDFTRVTIKIDDAHASALVGATAKVKALDRDGRNEADERAVDFRFVKEGSDWIVTTVTVWPKGEAAPE
jgi:hypothetical protein